MKLSWMEKRFLRAALILNGLCLALFAWRWILTGVGRYLFIPGNLLLAWLGFLFGWLLVRQLKTGSWNSGRAVLLTVLWLLFVPNCWYVMSDLVHMINNGEISQLYDIALFISLIAAGFLAGFASLFLVHKQILRWLSRGWAWLAVAAIILFSSFAIYLGRDLRWSSGDVVVNPGGLLLNVSDRLIDPFGRPRMFNVTSIFVVTIGLGYLAIWELLKPEN